MNKNFVGRQSDLNQLASEYRRERSSLVVLFGRRRIGKSELVANFCKRYPSLLFDGLENEQSSYQIEHLRSQLQAQIQDSILEDVVWKNWNKFFDYLTRYTAKQKRKTVLFFDEYQWLTCQQSRLTALIKSYWDNHWKNSGKVMLILCGSVSSFMVKKVIHSKALYGRINLEMQILPMSLQEMMLLLRNKRSQAECLKYYLLLGGIPKYFSSIEVNKSFEQNIQALFFSISSEYLDEYSKIFYSQFKESAVYEKIVSFLEDGAKTYSQNIKRLKMRDGGGAKSYITNLELAGFIQQVSNPLKSSREKKYYISDEYVRFYFKYVFPHAKIIKHGFSQNIFQQKIVPLWRPWLGITFEFFCLKNAALLARIMGFEGEVVSFGSLFSRDESENNHRFQIDLLYRRPGIITVCEIKYTEKPIGIEVIGEVQGRASKLLPLLDGSTTIEYALIAPAGITRQLKGKKFFHYVVQLKDLF